MSKMTRGAFLKALAALGLAPAALKARDAEPPEVPETTLDVSGEYSLNARWTSVPDGRLSARCAPAGGGRTWRFPGVAGTLFLPGGEVALTVEEIEERLPSREVLTWDGPDHFLAGERHAIIKERVPWGSAPPLEEEGRGLGLSGRLVIESDCGALPGRVTYEEAMITEVWAEREGLTLVIRADGEPEID